MNLGLVGNGRAAQTLAPLLTASGHRIIWRWSRGNEGPMQGLPTADVVLLAVSDGAIEEVARDLAERPCAADEVWLHLSGALPSSVARRDSDRPRSVGTLHPMVALPGAHASPELLHGATCGIAGEPEALVTARSLGTDLQLRVVEISDDERALYHAAAVSVAGHATALLAQATEMLQKVGFEEPQARAALASLMGSALSNAESGSPRSQITGPVARGDARTVALHLEAIKRDLPDALPAYVSLAGASLEISRADISPDDARRLEDVLDRFSR